MQEAGFSNFEFYQENHTAIDVYCAGADAVIFNLGYLPGHSKNIITRPETTLEAVSKSLQLLHPGGLLSIMCYIGHPGGKEEADLVSQRLAELAKEEYDVVQIRHTNRSDQAPYLLLVSKKGE